MAPRRPEDLMEIDAIDSLLGEPAKPRPQVDTAVSRPRGEPSPMPQINAPPPDLVPQVPPGGANPPSFSREPSGLMDTPTDVGSRGGATTTTPPPPAPSPTPPAGPATTPPVTTDTGGPAPPPATTAGGSGSTGGGTARASSASNFNDAYNTFTGSVSPNASREEMEAAINAAFANVPGFRGAYKESVNINGVWYDLVGGYGGPNATFQKMAKTGGGAGGFGAGLMELGGLSGGVGAGAGAQDQGRLDAILASIDAMARGVDSPLQKQAIDQELAAPAALADPAAMLQQAQVQAQAQARPVRARAGVVNA